MKLIFIHPIKEIILTPYDFLNESNPYGKVRIMSKKGNYLFDDPANGLKYEAEVLSLDDVLKDPNNEWICVDVDNYITYEQNSEIRDAILDIDPASIASVNYDIPKILHIISNQVHRGALLEPFKFKIAEIIRRYNG